MENSLSTKVEETAWFSSDSVSSVTLINLIAATMKAQLRPWQ